MCIFDQEDWIFPQQFEKQKKDQNENQNSSFRQHDGLKNLNLRKTKPEQINFDHLNNKKKDQMKKILSYYTNQIKSSNYQKTGQINYDNIVHDEFLEEDEFAELKGKYDDFGLGDVVIVFPNPDYDGKDKIENRGVKLTEAMKVYDNVLSVINEETQKSQLEIERKSFLLAFLTLSEFKKKDDGNNKKNATNSYDTYKTKKVNIEDQKKKYEIYKQQVKEAEELEEKGNLVVYPAKISKDIQRNYDPIKELLKVDINEAKQCEPKQYCQGGYAKKQDKGAEWLCTNGPPQDFLTLVRFTIISKLNLNCKLHTRSFISSDGSQFFLMIKSQTQNIREQAQNMKISKQLELGYADIFSLEPCDKNFRPLRLKDFIRSQQSDKLQKLIKQIKLDKERRNKSTKDDRTNKIVGAFAEKTQMGYRKIQLWNEDELQAQIICKQIEIDKYIQKISKDLRIDQNNEKVVVIRDSEISIQEWQAYYVYMQYFEYFMQYMEQLEQYDEIEQNKPLLYKLIYRKALGASNQLWLQYNNTFIQNIVQGKKILQNLWDRLDLPPIAPFANYLDPSKKSDQKQIWSIWRQFDINENNLREEFLCMEKIKITNAQVLRNINLLKLIKEKLATQYFPIHDPYQLKGLVKKPMFESLLTGGLLNKQKEQTVGEKFLKILFEEMADEAESTDYNPESIDFDAQFNYQTPWKIPIEALRNYFGDKLGIYFCFMQFYAYQLSYMAFIGLIAQILFSQLSGEMFDIFTIIFSCIIILWSTVFIELWKREEVQYSVQFGQQNFENDEAERPQFYGIMRRSITNDDLNELFYSPFIRKMKTMLSLAISLIILVMVILVNVGIFRLKEQLQGQKSPLPYIPAVLQAIQIQIFNLVYSKLGEIFNDFENHKIFSSYENSFIIKSFLFTFVNTFISFYIIAFLSSYFIGLNLCLVDDKNDCFKTLQNQLITIFLTAFAQKIIENVSSYVTIYNNEIQLQKKQEINIQHPFNQIDQFIESQAKLIAYETNEQVDGTVNDYTEVLIQFAFISLFGLAFPLSFTLAFIRNLIEIQSDMRKFIRYQRRPFPQGASNIGNWKIMLEFITFFGIFTNAGLIVYTSGTIVILKFQWFVILIVLFLGLKFFIRFLIPDTPQNIITLNSRHQFVADKLIKGFNKYINVDFNPIKPNLNLAGLNQANKSNIKQEIK